MHWWKVQHQRANFRSDSSINKTINERDYNLILQQIGRTDQKTEHSVDKNQLIDQTMQELRNKVKTQGVSFIQQHYLNKGLKIFPDRGKKAAFCHEGASPAYETTMLESSPC